MANAFNYSNTAIQTTLSGSISNVALTITVAATTGFPIAFPYILALDFGGAAEELVPVSSAAGTTLTLSSRGFGGTSAQSHSLGAVVRHVYNAQDATDFRTHEGSTGAVHGLTGNIVGTTDTQTLTNKTLTNPTINAATLTGTVAGTFTATGSPTFIGAPGATVQPAAAANLGLIVQGQASQSGNLQEWRDSTAAGLLVVTASGRIIAQPTNTAVTPITVNAPSGSTGNLLDLQNNGTSLAKFTNNGLLNIVPPSGINSTALLINEATGFAGNFTDLQVNAVSKFSVTQTGFTTMAGGWAAGAGGVTSVDASGNLTVNGPSIGGSATLKGYLGIGGFDFVRRTSNQLQTSNTTLTNDTQLFLTVNANFVYMLDGYLEYDGTFGPNTSDIKFDWTLPTGGSLTWSPFGLAANDTSQKLNTNQAANGTAVSLGTYGTGGAHTTARPFGLVTIGSTGGTLQLKWAQVVSNATSTTMYAGSWLRIQRIA